MGKVKAYELDEVVVSFVSFVEEGANGEKFQIYKSKDAKGNPPPKTEVKKDDIQVTDENLGFLEKVYNALKGLNKKNSINKENYQMDETTEKKLIKDVGDLTDSIGTMVKGISAITKEVAGLKKTAAESVPEEKSELQKTVESLQSEIAGLKKEAEGEETPAGDETPDETPADETPKGEETPDETPAEDNADLKKEIGDLKKSIDELKKARGQSNSQSSETKKNADDDDDDIFSGLLG